ncbi:MAG: response regulator [Chloroflexota bacterium]
MKILLIDDDAISLSVFSEVLNLHGHECIAYSTPDEGVEDFRLNADYDLVITDYKMPMFNGIDVLRMISSINPAAKIIIYSGMQDDHVRKECFRFGAFDYISKPINWTKFIEKIDKLETPN